ncbi:MAG TPA: PHB depolymerase family esterase [Fibrobacteria bacterium]|nr:PHB depolymerase family esterase [Fibrobacteria bacterium]
MNRTTLLAAALILSTMVSGNAQTNTTLTLQVEGKTRSCVIHVPSGIDKPPVVFFVHGANGSGGAFRTETRGDATADRGKFIAAYPSASSNGSAGIWADMRGTGEFSFFLAVLDTLDARYKIDRQRVYMTGFSQGGIISYAAACFYSDVFAAVAPVSGHAITPCTLKRPVPVHMTFGTSEGSPSFVQDFNAWQRLNSCPSTPPTITRPYPATSPNSRVTQVRQGPCAQGSSVVMDSVSGQGHQWPGANNLVQADEVWTFFKQYSLEGATNSRSRKEAPDHEPFSVSYASGRIRLEGLGGEERIRVADTRGRQVATAVAGHPIAFEGHPGAVYVVTAQGRGGTVARKFLVP